MLGALSCQARLGQLGLGSVSASDKRASRELREGNQRQKRELDLAIRSLISYAGVEDGMRRDYRGSHWRRSIWWHKILDRNANAISRVHASFPLSRASQDRRFQDKHPSVLLHSCCISRRKRTEL
jgi:hypothetical protein